MIAKDIKTGHIVNYNDAPCMIESITVQSPSARGAATFYKYRARNLITKQKVDITLRGGESLAEADFRKRPIKFMYADATHMHFLDQEDYNQYSLPKDDLAEESKYLTEDLEGLQALIYNDECVGIQLPVTVALKVVQCDPGDQGGLGHLAEQARHAAKPAWSSRCPSISPKARSSRSTPAPGSISRGREREGGGRKAEGSGPGGASRRGTSMRRKVSCVSGPDFLDPADRLAAGKARGDLLAGGQLGGVADHAAVGGPLRQAVAAAQHGQRTERFQPGGGGIELPARHAAAGCGRRGRQPRSNSSSRRVRSSIRCKGRRKTR